MKIQHIYCLLGIFLLPFTLRSQGQTIDNKFEIGVSTDGTEDFTTIQDAIDHVRDFAEYPVVVQIHPGTYFEKLIIPINKRNIILRGFDKENTIIRYDDYSGKKMPTKDINGKENHSTYTSYTLRIEGDDCAVENLTIENTAGRVGQAVALHTVGDRIKVLNCNIFGNQDSFYLSKAGARVFVNNTHIKGTTDYIFGASTAYFQNCIIESLSNSYITAASTTQHDAFGLIFYNCNLIAQGNDVNKVYLGRPWRPYAKTIFLQCSLGSHITAKAWDPWAGDKNFPDKYKTTYYAEYQNTGEGAKDLSQRVEWSHQLTDEEAKKYNIQNVLKGWDPLAKK
ncbi:pectinesterase family protein [Sphingobacterium bovistauri]|uniref:Pectinesterase n=1 Tax=Sphingobacterium bovistauri TaxID=2781959 RepID=A0ABS7Z1K1_9SPHI|nr:pectinesterase family protein [Sphingobacterium bovistauri]MCA5004006.1 pectin esterase [Sphingobacterium bovistauri]